MPDLDRTGKSELHPYPPSRNPNLTRHHQRRVQRQLKSPLKTRQPPNQHLPTNRQKHQSRSRPRRENQSKR